MEPSAGLILSVCSPLVARTQAAAQEADRQDAVEPNVSQHSPTEQVCEATSGAATVITDSVEAEDDWVEGGGALLGEFERMVRATHRLYASSIFAEAEKAVLDAFLDPLSISAKALFVRLYTRKPTAFRIAALEAKYREVGDVHAALAELALASLVLLPQPHEVCEANLEPIVHQMTLNELRSVAAKAALPIRGYVRDDLRDALLERLGSSGPVRLRSAQLKAALDNVSAIVGLVVIVPTIVCETFRRCERLYFMGAGGLQIAAVSAMGKLKCPDYRIWTDRVECDSIEPIYASRDQMVEHEAAVHTAIAFDGAINDDDRELVISIGGEACTALEAMQPQQLAEWERLRRRRPFAARFRREHVLALILVVLVAFLEKQKLYAEAAALIARLLATPLCPERRGHLWVRLCIDKKHSFGTHASKAAATEGLRDPSVRSGDRVNLARRLSVGKEPSESDEHHMVYISASRFKTASEIKSASHQGHCKFVGYSEEDGVIVRVEALVLQIYANEAQWQGVHSESGIWTMLFVLLFWEQIFDDSVPDAFLYPGQTAPLDMFTETFYVARQQSIEARLQWLSSASPSHIAAAVLAAYSTHQGTLCRGVSWTRWSAHDVSTIAGCIGGCALSVVSRAYAEDYSAWSAGMPDLLVWCRCACCAPIGDSGCFGSARAVEVKSENDRLSDQQRACLALLTTAGMPVDVAKIESAGTRPLSIPRPSCTTKPVVSTAPP
jgi:Fanconi-associated nuclease 1